MTTTQRNLILAGLLEDGIIDEDWLAAPCKIPHTNDVQPQQRALWEWLTVATFITIAALTMALIAFVALNRGEL